MSILKITKVALKYCIYLIFTCLVMYSEYRMFPTNHSSSEGYSKKVFHYLIVKVQHK